MDATRRTTICFALLAPLVALLWSYLSSLSGEHEQHIQRVPFSSDADTLIKGFAARRTPAVFSRGSLSPITSNWTALKFWTPSMLSVLIPTIPSLYSNEQSPYFVWEDPGRPFGRSLGLRVAAGHGFLTNGSARAFFMRCCNESLRTPPYLYLSAKLHHAPYAALLDDHATPRRWMSAPADLPELRGQDANIYAGEAQTTAHAHYDQGHTVFAQVHGRKRFELWAPSAWPVLQLHPHAHPGWRQSQLPVDGVDGARPSPDWTAILEPGDALYIPPFHFHRVTSLTFSVGLSVATDSSEGERFDEACRQGLPHALLEAATPRAERVRVAQRFLLGALLNLAGPHLSPSPDRPHHPHSYVRDAILQPRFAPLAHALSCDDAETVAVQEALCLPPCEVAAGGAAALDPTVVALARRVLASLAGAPPGGASGVKQQDESAWRLDGVGHISLQDYVEHLAAYAVGERHVCAFLRVCLTCERPSSAE